MIKKRLVWTTCPICKQKKAIVVDRERYLDWTSGCINVQDIEGLNADEKEALLTGICPECWDKAFKRYQL